jgi:hypothetical protein
VCAYIEVGTNFWGEYLMAILKVNWQDEELDIYYKKNGYPKSVWQDNEGKPFGIYSYDSQEDLDNGYDVVDVQWFTTEQERDQAFQEMKAEDDNPNSVGYYGYNQKTDNYYPNLDD